MKGFVYMQTAILTGVGMKAMCCIFSLHDTSLPILAFNPYKLH